jgi:hypothetical protein
VPARLLRRGLSLVLLAALGSSSACLHGCLGFDGQTAVLRHDTALDNVDLLLVYRGLHATEPVDEAVELFRKVRSQRVVALGSPMLFLDLDGVLDPPADEGHVPDELLTRLRAALAGVQVQDLGLWLDDAGRLCGAQRVHVPGVAAVLEQVNAALRDRLLADAHAMEDMIDDLGLTQAEDVAAAQRTLAAAPGFAFVALQRGTVSLSLPLAAGQIARARAAVLAELAEIETRAADGNPDAGKARGFLIDHDINLRTDAGGLHLVLGDPTRDELVLQWPAQRPADVALVEALRAQRWEIGGPETEDAVRAAFDVPAGGAR